MSQNNQAQAQQVASQAQTDTEQEVKTAQAALRELVQTAIDALYDVSKSPTVGNLSAALDAMTMLKDGARGASLTLRDRDGRPITQDAPGWYRFLAKIDPKASGIISHNRTRKTA